jgi:hypothetical protein
MTEISEPSETCDDSVPDAGVLADAQALWLELRELGYDSFRLAGLETQRAGKSLVDMLVAGVMVAILLVSAWLGLVAAAMLVLIELGIATSSAIMLAVAANLLLALMLSVVIRRKRHYLRFPAILRSLKPIPDGEK